MATPTITLLSDLQPAEDSSPPWIEDNIGIVLLIGGLIFCVLILLLVCLTRMGKKEEEEEENTLTASILKNSGISGEAMTPTIKQKPRFEIPPPNIQNSPNIQKSPSIQKSPNFQFEEEEQSQKSPSEATTAPIDPLGEEIDNAVDHLIKSRIAQEKVSQLTGSPLLLHGKTILDGHRDPDDEQEQVISRAILDPLQPHMAAALSGEWVTSRGLRLEVSMHSVVSAGDGSRARLMMLRDETIVLRDVGKLLRMTDDRVTGPAPESLKWEDGTFWMRSSKSIVKQKSPSTPHGISSGLRVETLKGRGTVLRLYAEGDKIPYWYIRLDSSPHKETLVSSLQMRILPWYAQDAVLQLEAHPATQDFEEFSDHNVKRLVEKSDEEYKQRQEEEERNAARRTEVETQLQEFHKKSYIPAFVIPPSPRSRLAFSDLDI